jgi:hypothetical protein
MIRDQPRRYVLRCQCDDCKLPYAYVQNGVLTIQSKHYLSRHTNVITLDELQRLIQQSIDMHVTIDEDDDMP